METDGGTVSLITLRLRPAKSPLSLAGRAWRAIQLSKSTGRLHSARPGSSGSSRANSSSSLARCCRNRQVSEQNPFRRRPTRGTPQNRQEWAVKTRLGFCTGRSASRSGSAWVSRCFAPFAVCRIGTAATDHALPAPRRERPDPAVFVAERQRARTFNGHSTDRHDVH